MDAELAKVREALNEWKHRYEVLAEAARKTLEWAEDPYSFENPKTLFSPLEAALLTPPTGDAE